ncbi:MAG: hypothetical protein ACO1OF_16165 [Adhaeribacter sp.]
MKKTAYIILISLAFLGSSCGGAGQNAQAPKEGYGANESGLQDDNQSGGGQVDDNQRGADASSNGGTMNNTATADSMHAPGRVNETEAARATEKTQQQVGSSVTRGEANESKSRTTENREIKE